jgi:hypothetical protein
MSINYSKCGEKSSHHTTTNPRLELVWRNSNSAPFAWRGTPPTIERMRSNWVRKEKEREGGTTIYYIPNGPQRSVRIHGSIELYIGNP